MKTINIAPDPGPMAAVFREGIDKAQEKIAICEEISEQIGAANEYGLIQSVHRLSPEEREFVSEGLDLILDQEIERIRNLQAALDECELAIKANLLLRRLSEATAYLTDDREQPLRNLVSGAHELIGKLAEKAGMKA